MRKKKSEFIEDLINSVKQDFEKRQKDRKPFEAEWRLNNNFFIGKQYTNINLLMDIEDNEKSYFWQERNVFNHIASIIEDRVSKLTAVKPEMDILPSSPSKDDQQIAELSQDILRSVYEKLDLSSVISKAIKWSEITGTSFYKVVWNHNQGKKITNSSGDFVYEGEVSVCAVSPFEIFPDNNSCEDINDCESIIHAKAYSVRAIKNIWGVDVSGKDIDIFDYSSTSLSSSTKHDHAIVIEKYEAPSQQFPNGRLVIVCEDKLLYVGDLPFINLPDGKRGFPFIKQNCLSVVGCFWGKSIISKIIPVQRAYNAVKNRKHEFLNRISMGVLTVEDGSIDVEDLIQDGLEPGKVIIYRQGGTPPKFLEEENLPSCFDKEEESLLQEFSEISGVTNILSNQFSANSLSGTALELLIEQDSSRLNSTIEQIDGAVKSMAKMILRLYKQFAVLPRLIRVSNDKKEISVKYFKSSDLGLEDVVFMSDCSLSESLSTKREHILKLLDSDIFRDENGKIDEQFKNKVLEIFGINI